MKTLIITIICFILTLIILFTGVGWFSCKESTYHKIKKYVDQIKVVDTHEHQRVPYNDTTYVFFNMISYLYDDLTSLGVQNVNIQPVRHIDTDSVWAIYEKAYNYCRTTSYHAQMMYTLRILYGYNKMYLIKDDAKPVFEKMRNNYFKNYGQWFDEVFARTGFETMFLDQYWDQFNTNIDKRYYKLVVRCDDLIIKTSEAAEKKEILLPDEIINKMNLKVKGLNDLNTYLKVVDAVLSYFKKEGAVCIKSALAYGRTLEFDEIGYETANAIYTKKANLSQSEKQQLENYTFHYIIEKSVILDLPVQIHTGYLAGHSGVLDNGQPMKLFPVFKKYPKAKFVLFHGGYPYTSEFVAIAKAFPNVYLDLVWLPQISRSAAIRTLHEILDCVPYNKICWGGDVMTIDDAVGALELGKEIVATVLSERIEKGWISEDVSYIVAKCIFRENAIALYNLP